MAALHSAKKSTVLRDGLAHNFGREDNKVQLRLSQSPLTDTGVELADNEPLPSWPV